MVTAELERNPRVANADTVDRVDVPEPPGLAGGDALATRESGKNRQVNHVDAPHDVLHRSGTDLAQWALRENCV
jgi:hypothetical protein